MVPFLANRNQPQAPNPKPKPVRRSFSEGGSPKPIAFYVSLQR